MEEEVDCAAVFSDVKLSDALEAELNTLLSEEDVEVDSEVVVSVVEISEVVDVVVLVCELSSVIVSRVVCKVVSEGIGVRVIDESDVVRSELVVCVTREVGVAEAVVSEKVDGEVFASTIELDAAAPEYVELEVVVEDVVELVDSLPRVVVVAPVPEVEKVAD